MPPCRALRLVAATLATSAALTAPTGAAADPARRAVAPTAAHRSPGPGSVLGGRLLSPDEPLLAAGFGWPGFWAGAIFAPTPAVNVGLVAEVLYGSPALGLRTGIGGGFRMPIRWRLGTAGGVDLAALVAPEATVGQATLAGAPSSLAGAPGFVAALDLGLLASAPASATVTLGLGLVTSGGVASVPEASPALSGYGSLRLAASAEAVMSRDTRLFAEAGAGYGLATAGTFEERAVVRVSLGIAYRM